VDGRAAMQAQAGPVVSRRSGTSSTAAAAEAMAAAAAAAADIFVHNNVPRGLASLTMQPRRRAAGCRAARRRPRLPWASRRRSKLTRTAAAAILEGRRPKDAGHLQVAAWRCREGGVRR